MVENFVHCSFETDSEDLTSNSDVNSDVDGDFGRGLVVAVAEGLNPCNDSFSASGFSSSDKMYPR